MVLTCSAYGCTVRFKKGIKFHHFPANRIVAKAWCIAMRRKDFVPSQHTRLCSKHFTEDCYELSSSGKSIRLKKSAVPTVFDFPNHKSAPQVHVSEPIIIEKKYSYPRHRKSKSKCKILPKPENKQSNFNNTSNENTNVHSGNPLVLMPSVKTFNNITIISLLPLNSTKAGGMSQATNGTNNHTVISVPVSATAPSETFTVIPKEVSKTSSEMVPAECTPEAIIYDCSTDSTESNNSSGTVLSSTQGEISEECNGTTESMFVDSSSESNQSYSDKSCSQLTEDRLRDHNFQMDNLKKKSSQEQSLTLSEEKVKKFLVSTTGQIESQQNEIKFLRHNLRQLRRNVARYRTLLSKLSKEKLISDEVEKTLKLL